MIKSQRKSERTKENIARACRKAVEEYQKLLDEDNKELKIRINYVAVSLFCVLSIFSILFFSTINVNVRVNSIIWSIMSIISFLICLKQRNKLEEFRKHRKYAHPVTVYVS